MKVELVTSVPSYYFLQNTAQYIHKVVMDNGYTFFFATSSDQTDITEPEVLHMIKHSYNVIEQSKQYMQADPYAEYNPVSLLQQHMFHKTTNFIKYEDCKKIYSFYKKNESFISELLLNDILKKHSG